MSKEIKKQGTVRETIDSIIVAFVIAMIIKTFLIQAYKIPTGSMLDTLLVGDHILVSKLAYIFSDPEVDDIIVFRYPLDPSMDYIKRVVGVPGDKIEIIDKQIIRNGETVSSDFTRFNSAIVYPPDVSTRDNVIEFIVPKDTYFVLGDNRDSSFDSRFWGFVDKELVVGEALMIYWSWGSGEESKVRFNRIGKLIK